MGLGSCPKCWDDVCTCGEMYKSWSLAQLYELYRVLQKEIRRTSLRWSRTSHLRIFRKAKFLKE